MIPQSTKYPEFLDDDDNLFLVHDSLRVRLSEDYNPGDKSIKIEGNEEVIAKFPPTGIITLTEQCSDIDKRAISFYYGSRTSSGFENIERLPEFLDVVKPKIITNVTMNVLDKHHNHLKDALIATQEFLGIKNESANVPFGNTITSRINFLKKLVLQPKAWFSTNKRVGLVSPENPFCVTFKEECLRVDENTIFIWNFGDNTSPISTTISVTDEATNELNARFRDLDGKEITKCYRNPGVYTVSLTSINEYGQDTVTFSDLITVKWESPEKALISINSKSNQIYEEGQKYSDINDKRNFGRYEVQPKIRSSTNSFIDIEVRQEEVKLPDGFGTGYSSGGEPLDDQDVPRPIDQIIEYTWDLNDELEHLNSSATRASYSVGGYYDLTLRVDTQYGAYRITSYKDAIDIVENQNLWFFNFKSKIPDGVSGASGGILKTWEYGLFSKTFKILGNEEINVNRDNSFLNYLENEVFYSGAKDIAKKEFDRNVEFAQQGSTSGDNGNCLLFWAGGGTESGDQKKIKITKYNAFSDTYNSVDDIDNKSWNWASLVSTSNIYFILGSSRTSDSEIPILGSNPVDRSRIDYDFLSLNASSVDERWGVIGGNFEDGAEEILSQTSNFTDSGVPTNGYFSAYRTTWKDSTGYVLRNSSVNQFFRLGDFYKTNGNLVREFNTLSKLPDVIGTTKTEGQLVTLSSGVFLFNNSGEVSAWNDTTLSWEVGRSSSTSLSFRSLQDSNISNFSDKSNTLLAASDSDKIAYLSFDYSEKSFIIFNATDLTFQSAGIRPLERQFKIGLY